MSIAEDIAARVEQMLQSLRYAPLAPFLADWPSAYVRRPVGKSDLPVLRWLADMSRDTAAFGADVVAALCRAAPSLAWRQTYSLQDLDAGFLDNYGWTEIFGGQGPLIAEGIACGFLLLGPSTHYPRHHHEAEEIYLPLRGTAAWQQGGAPWQERSPGTPIHHTSDEPHAMRTGPAPLLALYLWRSADLKQKARLA
jgi:Dimethlysulfonioproprionate lyase